MKAAVVTFEICSNPPTIPVKLGNLQIKFFIENFIRVMIRRRVSNCSAISLWFRFVIQLETRLASMVTAIIAAGGN